MSENIKIENDTIKVKREQFIIIAKRSGVTLRYDHWRGEVEIEAVMQDGMRISYNRKTGNIEMTSGIWTPELENTINFIRFCFIVDVHDISTYDFELVKTIITGWSWDIESEVCKEVWLTI